jgi:hypothetical protein
VSALQESSPALGRREGSQWWEEVARVAAQVPLSELVDGLDDVGHLPIPYAQLPRRDHEAYAATPWSVWRYRTNM